ncbi:hypothetical protein KSS87_017847 [Heliosperma pusillum]|nr:hypothetical protein KSS87_017847 [Heliosperma pusillum]
MMMMMILGVSGRETLISIRVQQQTIEVISYIATTTTKFPKKCVVLCLLGLSERVADIKTRVQAMKCLTIFSEAVGPGFIFDRLYKVMKEHKNPKVLSEGISWMVSAVEDFGVSYLNLKALIDFCKETGLQSSAAATRNATIKLIGILHKFVGPDIKGFLTDVKPALLSTLDAEYEKNPYEGPAAPKKTVKASDSSATPAGGADGLPREDISSKITPTLLKNIESPDWKTRLESIEAVQTILEEANKRIQPTGTGELFGALKGRLSDSNKKLVMEALSTIGGIAYAMGPAVEKASKGILSDVLKCLGDNKKQMRECVLANLDLWHAAAHLDKMIPYITAALSEPKLGAEGRKDLFDWLSRQLSVLNDFPDAVHLLKPVSIAITDKSADVRKAAEACLGEIFKACGPEMVTKNLRDIQGPAFALVAEKLKAYGAVPDLYDSTQISSTASLPKNNTRVGKAASTAPGDRAPKHGLKSVSLRAIQTRSSRSESVMSVHDISIQNQPLLNVKDSNKVLFATSQQYNMIPVSGDAFCFTHLNFQEDRERMVVRRFKFEEPRLEQIQDLESGVMRYFREDLSKRLLSADFKKQVDGIEMLHRALPSIGKDIIEVMDILLRWFVLRICESNTTCLLKTRAFEALGIWGNAVGLCIVITIFQEQVLEFLPELLEAMKSEGYALTEAEAAIFLPCFVEKSGHNIEKLREKMRELTKRIISVYSAAKLFPYVVEGLRSKNNRTRIECADLVGFLLEHHGSEISGQLKSLQIVASLTAERDGEIRKAALNSLATGYKILGEDVWRFVGKLTDAQRSMIDEKFKSKAREMDRRREGRPGDTRAALRRSVRDNGIDVAEQSGEVSRSIAGPVFAGLTSDNVIIKLVVSRENYTHPDLHIERSQLPRAVVGVSCPTNWNEALDIIAHAAPEQSVEGMKFVCHELLAQATNDPEGSAIDDTVKDADRLVSILAIKAHILHRLDLILLVAETFDFSLSGASSRSCKYVLNTLVQIFQNKTLAHAVKASTLNNLITKLLLWLLDERVPRMHEGDQLLKALNVLMLKILDHADRTSSFVVLLNLLHPLDSSRWPAPSSNEAIAVRNQKFSDLVVKCLIKLTKVLQSTIYEVDLDRILQSIHVYLQELGMDEIRRRAGADDKPLRMVKTVLHELVKLQGTAIKGHLSMVPIDMEPPPIILAYIDLNLQTLAAARMLTPTGPVGQTHWGDSTANNSSSTTHSADAQLKVTLD